MVLLRRTVMIDPNSARKITRIQAELIGKFNRTVSFSEVLGALVKEGLDSTDRAKRRLKK